MVFVQVHLLTWRLRASYIFVHWHDKEHDQQKKRLEQHCKDGAIKEHLTLKHQQNSTSELLQQNTCPVKQLRDTKRLFIYEALTILRERPFINRQKDNFINPLKLCSRTTALNQSQPNNSTSTNHPKKRGV